MNLPHYVRLVIAIVLMLPCELAGPMLHRANYRIPLHMAVARCNRQAQTNSSCKAWIGEHATLYLRGGASKSPAYRIAKGSALHERKYRQEDDGDDDTGEADQQPDMDYEDMAQLGISGARKTAHVGKKDKGQSRGTTGNNVVDDEHTEIQRARASKPKREKKRPNEQTKGPKSKRRDSDSEPQLEPGGSSQEDHSEQDESAVRGVETHDDPRPGDLIWGKPKRSVNAAPVRPNAYGVLVRGLEDVPVDDVKDVFSMVSDGCM
jgi:hypothetical protein